MHGHVGPVAEQFHEGGKADAGAKHLSGIGVSKLVRDDAGGDSDGSDGIVQWRGVCGSTSVGRGGGPASKRPCRGSRASEEAKALDELTNKGVDGTSVRFSACREEREWPTDPGPMVEAIEGQIDTFTDAHAGVAQQQENIAGQIIAAEQFLLDQLILFGVSGRGSRCGARGMSSRRIRWARSGSCAVQASSSSMQRR